MKNKNRKPLKRVCFFTAAAAAAAMLGSVYAETLRGDVNSDGVLNILDVISLKGVIAESGSDNAADISADGKVNSEDFTVLADYFTGKRDTLPEQKQPVKPDEPAVNDLTIIKASDDVCIRGDGKPENQDIINVAGFNAAVRRNVYIKFKNTQSAGEVNSAFVALHLSDTANGNTEVKICAADSSWSTENPPEYVSAPGKSGLLDAVVVKHKSDTGSIIRFDVTDYVRSHPDLDEYSFVLYCDHENNSDAVSNLALFTALDSADASGINAPYLEIKRGEKTVLSGSGQKADDTIVRFELPSAAGRFIRTSRGSLTTGRNISPIYDAQFKEVPGLAGNGSVSFESVSEPGKYLCRMDGCSQVILSEKSGSEDFAARASFIKVKGVADGTSYLAYGSPDRYLSCVGNEIFMTSADTAERKNNATFLMRSHKNVIMSDDFDGNELDTSVWAYNYPWADHHNYSAVARKSQVAVKDGKLVLTATRVAGDNWIKDDKGETGYTDNIGEKKWRKYSHLTGVVHLPFSRYPLNGNLYMEGKFRLPDRSGFWPAFWLNGNNSWPPEIDIFEYLSNTPEKIYVGIHRQDSSRPNGDGGAGWWIDRTASFFQKEFHTYALDWGSTYINYYIDGVLVKSIEDRAYIDNQKNMYLIINLGVGGWAEEPEDNTGDNTTYECDYVHIYGY